MSELLGFQLLSIVILNISNLLLDESLNLLLLEVSVENILKVKLFLLDVSVFSYKLFYSL